MICFTTFRKFDFDYADDFAQDVAVYCGENGIMSPTEKMELILNKEKNIQTFFIKLQKSPFSAYPCVVEGDIDGWYIQQRTYTIMSTAIQECCKNAEHFTISVRNNIIWVNIFKNNAVYARFQIRLITPSLLKEYRSSDCNFYDFPDQWVNITKLI